MRFAPSPGRLREELDFSAPDAVARRMSLFKCRLGISHAAGNAAAAGELGVPAQAMPDILLDLDQCGGARLMHISCMGDPSVTQQPVCNADKGGGRLPPLLTLSSSARRTVENCERELIQCRSMEMRLRDALAESEARLRRQDKLIQQQELLSRESDHRLMNDLQMTISLLSLQSRSATNADAAAQLAVAANRVSMIARIHHRLHSYEGVQAIEFRKFLGDFARDFSAMLSSDERPEQVLVEGIEINLPAATAIPLGFIVSELIANAAKYGNGRIAIRLQPDPAYGYALSVFNNGPALPEGFDPGASKGLGMKIIQSFARQIGGELRIGHGDDGKGARFDVLFPGRAADPAVDAV